MAIVAAPVFAAHHTVEDQANLALKAWETAYNQSDAAALGNLYTEDGAIFPPEGAAVSGRAAITAFWQAFIDESPGEKIELISVSVEAHGDAAVLVGHYRIIGKDGETTEAGKFLVLYKRTEGGWLMHLDMWNLGNEDHRSDPRRGRSSVSSQNELALMWRKQRQGNDRTAS